MLWPDDGPILGVARDRLTASFDDRGSRPAVASKITAATTGRRWPALLFHNRVLGDGHTTLTMWPNLRPGYSSTLNHNTSRGPLSTRHKTCLFFLFADRKWTRRQKPTVLARHIDTSSPLAPSLSERRGRCGSTRDRAAAGLWRGFDIV